MDPATGMYRGKQIITVGDSVQVAAVEKKAAVKPAAKKKTAVKKEDKK
jgi:hypothetical protein